MPPLWRTCHLIVTALKKERPGQKDELFYGYHISAGTMVREEKGPRVAELARRDARQDQNASAPPTVYQTVTSRPMLRLAL